MLRSTTFALALVAGLLSGTAAQAATAYSFVVAPILGANGRPLADDGGYVDGRTFTFSIAANETPTAFYSGLFRYPNYFVKSYSYTEFGSTTAVTVPATLGKNVVFFDYLNQGGLSLTNSGNRNFRLLADAVDNDQSEILYDDVAYKAALAADPAARPTFKLGTFTLSTYPRNGSRVQPIQNYTVTIAALAPVPEPASWALMLSGIGLMGTALRRRRAEEAGAATVA